LANNTVKGWEEKLTWDDMMDDGSSGGAITVAPEEPVQIVRDPDTNKVAKVIYGNMGRMMEGEPVIMWSEEILRDETTGQITGIQTVRPNGTMTVEHILRDETTGQFLGTKLEYL
jgi:hypothetical protein